jgi:hypothetical protein
MYSKISGSHFKTIFTVFKNPKLKKELEKFAIDNKFKIFLGKPLTQDIIIMPYFLAIIDRDLLGDKIWNDFLKSNEEVRPSGEYYILVDYRKDLNLPKYGEAYQISFDNESLVTRVIKRCARIAKTSEVRRCLWALNGYLLYLTKKELKNELIMIFERFPMVEACFYSGIAKGNNQIDKENNLSNYLATRSNEEVKLHIKNLYRTIPDVQKYYIDIMKQLFFSNNDGNVYL